MRFLTGFLMKIFLGLEESKKDPRYFKEHPLFKNYFIKKNDEIIIPGYLYTPPENTKICYVLLHGTTENRRSFVEGYHLVDKIDRRFMYYIPDVRGFGDSNDTFDKKAVYDDLYFSLDHLSKIFNIQEFIIIGQSLGGTLSLFFYNFYLSRHSDEEKWNIKNVFIFSSFISTKKVVKEGLYKRISVGLYFPSFFTNLIYKLITIPNNINFEIDELDPNINISSNILGFHGRPDDVVSFKHSEIIKENLKIEIYLDDELGHCEIFKEDKYWKLYIRN